MAQAESRDSVGPLAEGKRQAFAQAGPEKSRSMAYVQGKEGKFVAKNQGAGKSIAVFTSGGDAQGLLHFKLIFQIDSQSLSDQKHPSQSPRYI